MTTTERPDRARMWPRHPDAVGEPTDDLDLATYNLVAAWWHPQQHRWVAPLHAVGGDRVLELCGCPLCAEELEVRVAARTPPPPPPPKKVKPAPDPGNELVDAAAARAHILALVADGWTKSGVADAAGVARSVASVVSNGAPQVRRRVAEAILAVER